MIETSAYRKAFIRYLRKGTLIEQSSEEADNEHPAAYYIWRTRGDDKVRPTHAANDGIIFAWDDPPETGHPGEDYGCRCMAEPYYGDTEPRIINSIRASVFNYLGSVSYWENFEMSLYYFFGNGIPVTLDQIGQSEAIERYYNDHYFSRFSDQLLRNSRKAPSGAFSDSFDATYDFKGVLFSHGYSVIKGVFTGEIVDFPDGERRLVGKINFEFSDIFKDPLDIAQFHVKFYNLIINTLHANFSLFGSNYSISDFLLFDIYADKVLEEDLPKMLREAADIGRKPYGISHKWSMDYLTNVPQ